MAGVDIYNSNKCNAIVALGGGSPIDCAKGIAIVSTNHRHILSFEGVDKVEVPMPPLICIPTTAGTSADVSQFCIIASRQDRIKIAIISKAVIPDISLIDPVTTTTMDSYLTACTGMDALTHAIEAFVSTGSSMITDIHALEAIRIISKNIIEAVKKPGDINLRNKIMNGSLEAGLAFSNAILGAVHAMSHSLGGLLDLPHGECNSVLLQHVISFNFNAVPEKFNLIAEAMGLDLRGMSTNEKKKAFLSYINNLRRNVGIDKTLSKMGVNVSDINNLAKNAINDACMYTNPRPATERDIEVIYEEAL
jgi:alcohol dehydrogenase class IV